MAADAWGIDAGYGDAAMGVAEREVVLRTHRLLAEAPSMMITATPEDVLELAERPRPRAVAGALGGRPVMQEIDG